MGEIAGKSAEIRLVGHYNKAEIYGLLDADGTALINGAQGTAGFEAAAANFDAAAWKEIGDGCACATRRRKA